MRAQKSGRSGEAAHPAVRVVTAAVLDVEQGLADRAGDGADLVAAAVAVRRPSGQRCHGLAAVPDQPTDRGDHGGGPAGEDLADLAARDAVAPLVDEDAAL